MTVGKKIRAIRKSLKQTQKQLAKASGIGLNSIIRYEKGLRDPTISQLQKIAQGLGVPLVELLPEKDYGKTWLAYAYPPAHIDREAWGPCEACKEGTIEINIPEFRALAICNQHMNHDAFTLNLQTLFCPVCGRPLTEEAWKELENRVRGENNGKIWKI